MTFDEWWRDWKFAGAALPLPKDLARQAWDGAMAERDKCSFMGPMRDCPTHGEGKDAARYRWLRNTKRVGVAKVMFWKPGYGHFQDVPQEDFMDKAFDIAMAANP